LRIALLPFGFAHSRATWVNLRWKMANSRWKYTYVSELTHVRFILFYGNGQF